MTREFRKPINLGNGDASLGEVYKLIKRLEYGVAVHSGLSQGQGRIPKHEMEDGINEIKCVVADIATALNVEVTF